MSIGCDKILYLFFFDIYNILYFVEKCENGARDAKTVCLHPLRRECLPALSPHRRGESACFSATARFSGTELFCFVVRVVLLSASHRRGRCLCSVAPRCPAQPPRIGGAAGRHDLFSPCGAERHYSSPRMRTLGIKGFTSCLKACICASEQGERPRQSTASLSRKFCKE